MTHRKLLAVAAACSLALGAAVMPLALAGEPPKESAAGAKPPEMKLPPGWTAEDMQAMMAAGTPGKMQELLTSEAGEWEGKSTTWMPPGPPEAMPMTSDVRCTIKPLLGGRYTQVEVSGEMPGMGPYSGMGIYGYDNVAQKFVSTWIDSFSTGMMTGDGELSADGKTLTWNFSFHCPIAKKPVTMRQTETVGGDKKTLEMFGPDPKTGKVHQMMRIEMTRK